MSSSAAQDQREPPLCESKNCPNRAIGLVTDRNGVQWAACEKHAKDVLGDGCREGLELALRSEFDDDDALTAAQLVVAEGWRPPDEVSALREAAEKVVRAWMMSKVTPSNEITELQRVLKSGHRDEGADVR